MRAQMRETAGALLRGAGTLLAFAAPRRQDHPLADSVASRIDHAIVTARGRGMC